MINGKYHAWEDVTIILPNGPQVEAKNIEYSDERETEEVYGKGATPLGYGRGNYKAEGKLTLNLEGWHLFTLYLMAQNKGVYDLNPFPITVAYMQEGGVPHIDKLKQCKINKCSEKKGQGDKHFEVELDFNIIGGIVRDGVKPMGGIFDLH
jgi:hypothetical protein